MKIVKVSLRVKTTDGTTFGHSQTFGPGLNVIEGPNTIGKSTVLKSILYGLGLEGMLSAQRDVPLPRATTSALEWDGARHPVEESSCIVTLQDHDGQILSCQRAICSDELDIELIKTWTGSTSHADIFGGENPEKEFYVRKSGSASQPMGFHHFLAKFFEWDLPKVETYDGKYYPLYMECISPLFYVPQRNAWDKIGGKFPTYLGIRDMRRKSVEFLLGFKKVWQEHRIDKLNQRSSELRGRWESLKDELEEQSNQLGLVLDGIPKKISDTGEGGAIELLEPVGDDEFRDIEEHLEDLKRKNEKLSGEKIPKIEDRLQDLQKEYEKLQETRQRQETAVERSREDLGWYRAQLDSLDERLSDIRTSLRRIREVEKLQDVGGHETGEQTATCPTCEQEVSDLAQMLTGNVKGLDLLKEERSLVLDLKKEIEQKLEIERRRVTRLERAYQRTSRELSSVKEDLAEDREQYSVQSVYNRLVLEQRIEDLEEAVTRTSRDVEKLVELADEWHSVQEALDEATSGLTEEEKRTRQNWEKKFEELVTQFEFDSVSTGDVSLDQNSYAPVESGFEFGFDVSASDGIRINWAYFTSLFSVATQQSSMHPGFLVLDEPAQQAIDDSSFEKLVNWLSEQASTETGDSAGQSIVATSRDVDAIGRLDHTENARVYSYDSSLLSPIA